jgi:hypothetical protein
VLDAAGSNIDCFLCRHTRVSSTQLNRPPWTKKPFSTLITMIFRMYSFQNITQLSRGYNVLDATSSNLDVFFREIHAFL